MRLAPPEQTRWTARRLACIAVTFALASATILSMPETAHAGTSLGETLKGDAKAAYDEARSLFKAGDYKGSLQALERAQRLSPDPRLFWNMAACEKKLGHHAKAISLVERYLAGGAALLSDGERKEGADFVTAMRTLVGTVTITSSTDGVSLYVDDELVGATPFTKPIHVDSGDHVLRAARTGYKELTRKESVPAGGTAAWELVMEKDVHEGRIVVSAGAGESIWLDGALMGRAEWGGNVTSGKHTLLVTSAGKKSREEPVDIHDGDVKTLDLHLQQASAGGSNTWLFIGGGAVLAIGAVLGGYFLFKQSSSSPSDPKGTLGTFSFP